MIVKEDTLDKSTNKILTRLSLIASLTTSGHTLFERETRRGWQEEAQKQMRTLKRADGSTSQLGQALLRPRSIDRNLMFTPVPPWGGKLRISSWAYKASDGAFALGRTARERIVSRWSDALDIWRPL